MSCIFCQIAAGEIDSEIVYRDEQVVAFRDLNPQAPTHILIIPIQHIENLADASEEQAELLGHCSLVAAQIAQAEEIAQDGYRLVTNVGADGGQSVDHLHFHLLGGRRMHWPPG
jgi:histidine triad (HIT) family protein